jgi:RHH-type proline utilization regulon transcriptional repressor/proline dehydrogenase/delta 1-pyrroline-5-carboxylate dehydrogenase
MPEIPRVLSLQATVRGRRWLVRASQDLQALLLTPESTIQPSLQRALDLALAAPGSGPWRTVLDLAGALLSVAVDESQGWILLGSPRFATEATLVHALRHTPRLDTRYRAPLSELEALVAGWNACQAEHAPLVVHTAGLHLTDVVDPQGPWSLQHADLLVRTEQRAAAIAPDLRAYHPTVLERLSQTGLDWNARQAILRIHLLRFVAALPSLDHDRHGSEVQRLLAETLRRMLADSGKARDTQATGDRQALPEWMEAGARLVLWLVRVLPVLWVAGATRRAVRTLARIFIAGEDIERAGPALQALRDTGRDATLDQLGELVVSEAEADVYRDRVLELVRGLHLLYPTGETNAAGIERAHVSVKVSALCSDFNPDDPDGTWRRVGPRLLAILREARLLRVFINLDAEHYHVRDLNLRMLERALAEPDLRAWSSVGIVVQAYLRDAPAHLQAVLTLAKTRGVRMPVRLVKGAYWDAETTEAAAHDHLPPQFLNKAETDAMFQMLVLRILAHATELQLCVGSHNLRDHCFAHEARDLLHPHAPPVEHQALHMTYEALSTALAKQGWAVRNYIPVGSLLVGMAYLVRRILENSSQVGVLTMARAGHDTDDAMLPPGRALRRLQDAGQLERDGLVQADAQGSLPPFRNVAPVRLYLTEHRQALDAALLGRRLLAGLQGEGKACRNPSRPDEILARLPERTAADVDPAVRKARAAQQAWARKPVALRAMVLLRTAERLRVQRHDFAAVVALEAGKARAEALADVDEAIDFLQFYAREAIRIETEEQVEPVGVVAVVAPWNFPLAIPCGMAAAALVAGNAVLLKSAEQTPLVVELLTRLLHEVGAPPEVFQHLPGDGLEVGQPLTQHPDIDGVVFTGSRPVGTLLYRTLATQGKLAVTEMGGKNAIIVTANADLDEAVSGCLQSAYGHAGQKCSAASRILVDERIAPQFLERFAGAARDLQLGPAETPGTRVNPVISREDQHRLREAARACGDEARQAGGRVLVDRSEDPGIDGSFAVGPCAFLLPAQAGMLPQSLAQRELFGPIVHVLPVRDLDQAVDLFCGTEYALTGGIYAQSQDDIDSLSERLLCGNLYVNRPITGARVAVEPFGGFRMSGTGPKAGGREYLAVFYRHPVVTAPPDAEALAVLRDLERLEPGETPVHHAPWPDVSPADGLRLAVDLRESVAKLAELLPSEAVHAAGAVADVAVQQLPGLWDKSDGNRMIPGQDSFNRWSVPRGPVAVLVGRRVPGTSTVAQVTAALATGNPVRVLACSKAALRTWQAVAEVLGAGDRLEVRAIGSGEALAEALADPRLATVVIDGAAVDWSAALPLACAVPPGQDHLRAIRLAQGSRRAEALVRDHLHCRSFAVHTMRHGAPLAL